MKLNVKAFGLACSILWGVGLFLITWWLILLESAPRSAGLLGRVYLGYTITPLGSLVGALWAFVDAFICGAILAWLYNVIAARATEK